ncbi:MAG: hypothetical protein WCL16_12920, partial [bacterium]
MRNLRGGVFLLVMTTCWQTAVAGQETESFFKLRGRVLSSGGASVATNDFKFTLAGSNVWSRGTNWSEWIRRPCFNQTTTPGILRLDLSGGHDPCVAQLQTQIEGLDGVRTFDGKLYGSHWGLLHWQWEGRPYVTTMAEYNRMAWNLITVTNPSARIEHFPVAERYISGDNDRIALQEGIAGLTGVGFSALMIDGGKFGREYLLQAGLRRTAAAVYCPPGGPFDYGLADPHAALSKWAGDILKPLTNAGFASTDLALLAMADEPGWYYPACLRQLTNNPVALGRFRDYLKSQKLTPAELGAGSWSEVWPKGRSQAGDLPARRLFYWTMRFFPWDSARYSAQCTRALESAFYTNMPVFVNWNFFSGRSYVPGGVANNRDKSSPDAAMGGHDWMEFGRLRGSTMLWTEDWFGDELAYQWSYYSARLNSAARRGGVEFGG